MSRRSPRPTPSTTTTAPTASPRSDAEEMSLPGESGVEVDVGETSEGESDECDADSLADASDEKVRKRAMDLLGLSKLAKDKELPSVTRANSSHSEDALVKKAQASLLEKIKEATDSDWLRPCPAGFALPDEEIGPLPWHDAAFNTYAVTRSMHELGINDRGQPSAYEVDRSFHDLSFNEMNGMQANYLSNGVGRLDML